MSHFLLIYDRSAGQLLREQVFTASEEAMAARFAAEREFLGQDEIEIVAVSAESEADLRRTHGRYFLDLTGLVDRSLT